MTTQHPTCVLASNNKGKLRELLAILKPLSIHLVPQQQFNIDEAEETGLSFVENAILKARHASSMTGLPAIADDSGLQVYALNGEPGIYSARYADPEAGNNSDDQLNLEKVLTRLEHEDQRKARFVCVIALVLHPDDATPAIFEGFWEGEISRQPSGSGGFGYDPIFYIPALKCNSAQLDAEHKDRISHRAQALQKLSSFLISNPDYILC